MMQKGNILHKKNFCIVLMTQKFTIELHYIYSPGISSFRFLNFRGSLLSICTIAG